MPSKNYPSSSHRRQLTTALYNSNQNSLSKKQNQVAPTRSEIVERLMQKDILPNSALSKLLTPENIEKFTHLGKMALEVETTLQTKKIKSFFEKLGLLVPCTFSDLLKLVEPSKDCIDFKKNNYQLLTNLSINVEKNLNSPLLREMVCKGHSPLVEMLFMTDQERLDFIHWAKPIEKLITAEILPTTFYDKIFSDARNQKCYKHLKKVQKEIESMLKNENIQSFFRTLKLKMPRDLGDLLTLINIPEELHTNPQQNNYLMLTDLSVRLDKNLWSNSLRQMVLQKHCTLGEMLFMTDDKRDECKQWFKQYGFLETKKSSHTVTTTQDQSVSNTYFFASSGLKTANNSWMTPDKFDEVQAWAQRSACVRYTY